MPDDRKPGRSDDQQLLAAAARRHRAALTQGHANLLRWSRWLGQLQLAFSAMADEHANIAGTLRRHADQLARDEAQAQTFAAEVEAALNPDRRAS